MTIPRPPGDIWVFAYGSLMWRPDFEYLEAQPATVYGYHRALCIYSEVYRGTCDAPGLVFGLDRGGVCKGIAFRIADSQADMVMRALWEREMVTGVYRPRWLKSRLAKGPATIWGFIADREHAQYAGRLAEEDAVGLVLQGCGKAGPCLDYLINTLEHLDELGIHDRALRRLVTKAVADRQAKLKR